MDSDDPIAETKSYVSTEFFFYMLPNYLALVALGYRYYLITQQPPRRKVPELPGEILVTCFEEAYDEDYYNEEDSGVTPASYCIKSKVSQLNSYVYLLMCLMGLLGDPNLYYAAQHRQYSLIYFFGFISWQMSALVLRREYQRELGQSLWAHRFFWIFCGTFSVSKMFEDYLQPFNFILNSLQIATNSLLALYGLYRPEDKGDAFLQIDTETPSFAKGLFQTIELDPHVRRVLRVQDERVKTILIPGQDELTNAMEEIEVAIPGNSAREEIQLLNKLPKRNTFVNKRVRAKIVNESIKYYFHIITQLNTQRFEVERKYSEFEELDYSLGMHFSEQNFPKLKLPRLKKADFNRLGENDDSRRAEILEDWLKELLQNPIFIKQEMLDFLSIDTLNSAPFTTYYNATFKNFCSKLFLYSAVRERSLVDMRQQRVTILKVVEDILQPNKDYFKQVKSYEFTVTPEPEGLKSGYYTYEMVCRMADKTPLRWTLRKQEQQFSTLNGRIEEEVRQQVPFYYQYLMRIPENLVSTSQPSALKLQVYGQYLKKLLLSPEYFCLSLLKFINFDPLKGEVIGDHKQLISLEAMDALNYKNISRTFPVSGKPIEVTTIQIEEEEVGKGITYKFQIIFNSVRLTKTSKDLINLRNHVVKVYKSLVTIPEPPDFSSKLLPEDLEKMKLKVDEFLLGITVLPQISNNPTFKRFFAGDITQDGQEIQDT